MSNIRMSTTRVRNIKVLGWVGALFTAAASFIGGDFTTAIGIISAAAASSNLKN
jgi:hypothetical protein